MYKDCLVLHEPNIQIPFCSTLEKLKALLDNHGFTMKLSSRYNLESKTYEDGFPVYYGTARLFEDDEEAIHFHLSKFYKLESIIITNTKSYFGESLIKSYHKRQMWLEAIYGKPQFVNENSGYGDYNYEWKFDNYCLKHFIQDRFGDEEEIHFQFDAR